MRLHRDIARMSFVRYLDYPVRVLSELIKKGQRCRNIFFFMAASGGRQGMWDFGIAFLPGGERFGKLGRCRCGEGLWLRHERRERLALPSGTRRRDAFRFRLFRNMGRAIEGVLTFHFLGG